MKQSGSLMIMQECEAIGIPLWRLASMRRESVVVHAPMNLAFWDGEIRDPGHCVDQRQKAIVVAACRTFSRQLAPVDFLWEDSFAIYLPNTEQDLHDLCSATRDRGGSVQVISPIELSASDMSHVSHIWTSTSRRVRFLTEHNISRDIGVSWLYLLTLYNFNTLVTAFISDNIDIVNQFRRHAFGLPDFVEYDVDGVISAEQKDWDTIYRSIESKHPNRYWNPSD